MSFLKKPRQVVNYEPPINRNIISSGNTNLINIIDDNSTALQSTGSGTPVYYYTSNSTAYIRSLSGDLNTNVYTATTVDFGYYSGDTIIVGLQPNIIVNSISATTFYSGSTDLSLLLGGGSTSGITSATTVGNGQSLIHTVSANTIYLHSLSGGNLTNLTTDGNVIYIDHTLFKRGTGTKSFILSGTSSTATNTYSIALGTNNTNSGQYSTIMNGWGNVITSNHSIIHGRSNSISANYSVIGGGKTNTITSTATTQTIAGGYQNSIKGTGSHNALLGGATNIISGTSFNTIGGGQNNLIEGAIEHSFIGGGNLNKIQRSSLDSAIVGGLANNILNSTYSFIGGGRNNYISGNTITQSLIGGGFSNRIYDSRSTIGGGYLNRIKGVSNSFIGGGANNLISGSSSYAIIAGGRNNKIYTSFQGQTIAGGRNNLIGGNSASLNTIAGGYNNKVYGSFGIIGGGSGNRAGNTAGVATYAVIAGGKSNIIHSSVINGFIGGGQENIISGTSSSIVGGIRHNIASSFNVVGGGSGNTIGASSNYSLIGGGKINNITSSAYSFISSGLNNRITNGTHQIIIGGHNNVIQSAGTSHITIINGEYITGNTPFSVYLPKLFMMSATTGGTHLVTYSPNSDKQVHYKSLSAGTNVTITDNGENITISASASGGTGGTQTYVQDGINTYTGGTSSAPTVNLSDNIVLNSISANTISGGTFYSGSTPLQTIINNAIPSGANLWRGDGVSSIRANNNYTSANVNYGLVWGKYNSAYNNSDYATVAGQNNNINDSKWSSVLNGLNNIIVGSQSAIVLGMDNGIRGTAPYTSNQSSILGGKGNLIYNSVNSSINNGYRNKISGNSSYNIVYSSVLNGVSNKIYSIYSTILGGNSNIVKSKYSVVAGHNNSDDCGGITTYGFNTAFGENNTLYRTNFGFVAGSGHTLQAKYSVILGGINYSLTESNTVLVPKLKIANIPSASNTYVLLADSDGRVTKQAYSTGGTATQTFIQNGTNTYTGGTSSLPTVNVSALTIDNITVSGSSSFQSLSGTSLFSGSTNLSDLFVLSGVSLGGASIFTGKTGGILQFKGLSAGTNITFTDNPSYITVNASTAGGTPTYVQPGLNTYTGGTSSAPTVNISGASLNYLSATTISGGTIYSGSTNLETIIRSVVTGTTPDGYTYIVKSADQDVTNAGVTNDTELLFTTVAGGQYAISMDLYCCGNNTTADYTCQFAVDAGTMRGKGTQQGLTTAAAVANTLVTANAVANTTSVAVGVATANLDNLNFVTIQFACTVTNATTLRFKFGNATITAGATSRTKKGTILRYKKIN